MTNQIKWQVAKQTFDTEFAAFVFASIYSEKLQTLKVYEVVDGKKWCVAIFSYGELIA